MTNVNEVVENVEVKGTEVVENETPKMELLPEGTEYRDIAKTAKKLEISYVGKSKDDLFNMVNEKIAKINAGEIEMPVIEQPTNEDGSESGDTQGTEEGTSTKRERTPAAPRVKAPKWFEEKDAFPFQEGDVVEIVSGKDLIGRLVQVKQPSAKKNAFKGHLIHPVNGQLQKTFLSVDFDRVELRERNGQPVEEATPEVEVNNQGTQDQEAI